MRQTGDPADNGRLMALEAMRALEIGTSPLLSQLCEVARSAFDTPVACVTIIDRDTQHVRASSGLDFTSIPRRDSFCDFTIRGDEVFVVPDAAGDPRFAANPLVIGEPKIRFYAGAPLVADDGIRIGAFCVVGKESRAFTEDDEELLRRFAETARMELRRQRFELAAVEASAALSNTVTEAVNQRDALEERTAVLERAAHATGSGSWELDLTTGELIWSNGFYDLLGVAPDCGRPPGEILSDRVHPDDRHTLQEARDAAKAGQSFSLDMRIVTDDGSVVYLSSRGEPFGVQDGGAPARMVGVIRDVTREKATEAALRESEDHYRHAVKLSPQIPWTADAAGNILEAGPRWVAITGQSAEETLGTGWVRALHPDDLEATTSGWGEALATARPVDVQYRVRTANGDYRWFRAYAAPRRGNDGSILRWYGTLEDIHDSKLAEEARKASETFLRSVLDSSSDCIVVIGSDGRVGSLNRHAASLLGSAGVPFPCDGEWSELWPDESRAEAQRAVLLAREGIGARFSGRYMGAGGASTWWDVTVDPIFGGDGHVAYLLAVSREVTGERRLRDDTEAARERLASVLESTSDCVLVVDHDWRITYLNGQAIEFLSRSRRTRVGDGFWDLYAEYVGSEFDLRYRDALRTGQPVSFEAYLDHADSWLLVNAYPGYGGLSIFFRDVTEARRAREELVRLAHTDPLTGLANRARFTSVLEEVLGAADASHVSVLLLDLDLFKEVNDTLGHPVGDALLKAVAERLAGEVRSSDLLARLGGDEFAVVCRKAVDGSFDDTLAARLITCFGQPFRVQGNAIRLAASVGIASAGRSLCSADELFRAADIALYRAKEEGRRTVRSFDEQMSEKVLARQRLKQDLGVALDRGELRLVYQPILDLVSDVIVGFEALLRWRHPVQGEISPAEFIPLAEETGLIVLIGDWVLETACRMASTWPRGMRVAVNVSPVQFRDETLPLRVMQALCRSGAEAVRLELEITESVLMTDSEFNMRSLYAFREAGISIALDDFGTGFSSLSYLRRFPFDKLKLDRSFLNDIGRSREGEAIVRAAGEMGRALAMTTTAEGVETREQLDWLRDNGWTQAQGYLIGRPLEEENVAALLARSEEVGQTEGTKMIA